MLNIYLALFKDAPPVLLAAKLAEGERDLDAVKRVLLSRGYDDPPVGFAMLVDEMVLCVVDPEDFDADNDDIPSAFYPIEPELAAYASEAEEMANNPSGET